LHHLVGHLLADVGPDVDHLVVALAVGDQPVGILPFDFRDLFLRFPDQLALLHWNEHVIDANGDPRACRVRKAEVLDTVEHDDRFAVTGLAVAGIDQLRQLLLGHQQVDGLERDPRRGDFAEEHPTARGGLFPAGWIAPGVFRHPGLADGGDPTSLDAAVSGTWTAIWSPSKSALKAAQTRGCRRIAFPSTKTGSNAWMPSRWSVGARFKSMGCSLMTSSRTSQTSGFSFSTRRLALLMVV